MVTETYSLINKEAKRTFVDQQKWLDYNFLKYQKKIFYDLN